MRIIYLHQYFTTPAMSGGTRSYEMARRLVRAGHRVDMVTSWRAAGAPPGAGERQAGGWTETEVEGIRVHWLPVPYSNHMPFRARIQAFFRFAWAAARQAAALEADLVFATSTPLTIALPAVYAARRRRVPMVLEVRDLWPTLPIAVGALRDPLSIAAARWLERFAYRNAARVIALSPGMRDGVARAGYPADRIAVVPNSCDLDLFRVPEERGRAFLAEHPHLAGGPLVLYAGTLGLINGVHYLTEIAAALRDLDPRVRFLIMGDGAQRDRVRARAEELGVLNRNLWMMPPLSKRDMPAVFSAATVAASLFVDMPAMWANSANKMFDALAAGRPLMINYRGWQAGMVEETGAGIVVPAADAPAAAARLHALLGDPEALTRAGAAAARLAETRFDRDRLAGDLRRVLEDVAAGAA
ncbi:glycosyltransferase family 4 protein [Azospirillum sp.]|uniref:glycosyltransferase family 4 protein n=1 Tax=Azospirillum sp. TaxID=34012 RepID=UPI002D51CD71|nr:glycosyltransferase family 4 protein [Azospirillum sp.]HYD64543.1 glycosyltransferase family 4 protein [Azospirillum sp.]